MFKKATVFNGDIGGWGQNVSNVRDYGRYVLRALVAFNQNIGGWNVGSVTNYESTCFRKATVSFNRRHRRLGCQQCHRI